MGGVRLVLGGVVVTVTVGSSSLDSSESSAVVVGGIIDFSFKLSPT